MFKVFSLVWYFNDILYKNETNDSLKGNKYKMFLNALGYRLLTSFS